MGDLGATAPKVQMVRGAQKTVPWKCATRSGIIELVSLKTSRNRQLCLRLALVLAVLGLPATGTGGPMRMPPIELVVRALLPDGLGGVWIGTFGSGLWYYVRGHIERVDARDDAPPLLKISRLQQHGNTLYAATAGYGFWRMQIDPTPPVGSAPPKLVQWQRLDPPYVGMSFLHGLLVLGPDCWVLGSVERGVARYEGGRWQALGPESGLLGQWVNDTVLCDTGIWVGTERGLTRLATDSAKILQKQHPIDDWMGATVNCLLATDAHLFIGTAGEGLLMAEPSGIIRRCPGTTGNIHAVVPWGNSVAVAGDDGMWLVNRAETTRVRGPWTRRDGLKSLAADPAGHLWIGTQTGKVFSMERNGTIRCVVSGRVVNSTGQFREVLR